MAKTIEQVAAETKWLDEAQAYAKTIGWDHGFDFSTIDEWQGYYQKGISPEEAVDDQLEDSEYEGD